VGAVDPLALAKGEATVKYHPAPCDVLTRARQTLLGTVAGGQFDWGGRLRKSNGGARMVPSVRSVLARRECNSRRAPNGETDTSSRYESRL
jgi:hypothetical protein